MQSKIWISFFQQWLADNRLRLAQGHFRVDMVGITAYSPSSIHVEFFADRYEATVQLWEDGQSDFHFLDWEVAKRNPDYQVEVTHYDFETPEQLTAALNGMVDRMSPVMVLQ